MPVAIILLQTDLINNQIFEQRFISIKLYKIRS